MTAADWRVPASPNSLHGWDCGLNWPLPLIHFNSSFVLETRTRTCGLELGVALQGHSIGQWWSWRFSPGGWWSLSGSAASPSPRLGEASPVVRVGGRAGGSVQGETGLSLRRPKSGPACPPFPSPSEQSPSLPPPQTNLLSLLIRLAFCSMVALLSWTSCL